MRTRRIAASAMVGLLAVVASGCDPEVIGYRDTTATQARATPTATGRPTPRPLVTTDISRLSAAKIVARTRAAAKGANSVRIKGVMVDGRDRKTLDMRLTKTTGQGSFSINGGSMSLIIIGRTAYLRVDYSFARQQAKSKAEADAVMALINGRWMKTSQLEKDLGETALLGSMPKFFDELLTPSGPPRKTSVRTVNGVRSIGIRDTNGTLWVDTATARPVRLEVHDKSETATLNFSEYNQVKAPKAPPANQVIDGKAFGK